MLPVKVRRLWSQTGALYPRLLQRLSGLFARSLADPVPTPRPHRARALIILSAPRTKFLPFPSFCHIWQAQRREFRAPSGARVVVVVEYEFVGGEKARWLCLSTAVFIILPAPSPSRTGYSRLGRDRQIAIPPVASGPKPTFFGQFVAAAQLSHCGHSPGTHRSFSLVVGQRAFVPLHSGQTPNPSSNWRYQSSHKPSVSVVRIFRTKSGLYK